MRRLVVAWLLALASGGCGLISSDVTETKFDLPSRSYSFDSAAFNVPTGFSQPIPCGPTQIVMDCCNPPIGAAPDCNANKIACEQDENGMDVCTVTVLVSQSQMMKRLGLDKELFASAVSGYEIGTREPPYPCC